MKTLCLSGKSYLEREIRLTPDCDMVKRLRPWSQECYVSTNDNIYISICVRSVLHHILCSLPIHIHIYIRLQLCARYRWCDIFIDRWAENCNYSVIYTFFRPVSSVTKKRWYFSFAILCIRNINNFVVLISIQFIYIAYTYEMYVLKNRKIYISNEKNMN